MSMETKNFEVEYKVSADRLFAAMADWHNLGPKAVPAVIKSATVVSGDGKSAGSVRQITFTSAMPFPFMKERLDFIDNENFEVKSSLVLEGTELAKQLESLSFHNKFNPSASGGCVVKTVVTTKPLSAVGLTDHNIITTAMHDGAGMVKAAETYLLANPSAYA